MGAILNFIINDNLLTSKHYFNCTMTTNFDEKAIDLARQKSVKSWNGKSSEMLKFRLNVFTMPISGQITGVPTSKNCCFFNALAMGMQQFGIGVDALALIRLCHFDTFVPTLDSEFDTDNENHCKCLFAILSAFPTIQIQIYFGFPGEEKSTWTTSVRPVRIFGEAPMRTYVIRLLNKVDQSYKHFELIVSIDVIDTVVTTTDDIIQKQSEILDGASSSTSKSRDFDMTPVDDLALVSVTRPIVDSSVLTMLNQQFLRVQTLTSMHTLEHLQMVSVYPRRVGTGTVSSSKVVTSGVTESMDGESFALINKLLEEDYKAIEDSYHDGSKLEQSKRVLQLRLEQEEKDVTVARELAQKLEQEEKDLILARRLDEEEKRTKYVSVPVPSVIEHKSVSESDSESMHYSVSRVPSAYVQALGIRERVDPHY